MNRKRILALIPARSGSKGVPNKNILNFGGHPLIAWSIQAAIKTAEITDVVVSTDSIEYQKIAESYGAEVPFLRPDSISEDSSGDFEFVDHAIEYLAQRGDEFDYIVHLRPTTPIRNPELLSKAIHRFASCDNSKTALRSLHATSESMYKGFEIAPDGTLLTIFDKNNDVEAANAPRQKFPSTYVANGYVDILRTEFVRKHKRIHGSNVEAFVTPMALELDTCEDVKLLKYEIENDPTLLDLLWS